jgi:hypothetical protein
MIRQEYPPMTRADLVVVKRALDLKRKHSLSAMPPPPATPKHLKRSFVDFSTPSSSSNSGSSTNVENKTPSPLANRRILRFQRVNGSIQGQSLESLSGNNGQWNWKEPPKKLRRTSIYLREDVTEPAVAMRRLSMGDLSPSERISPAVAYRRVTRIDPLPMVPYDAFRDVVKEDASFPRLSRLNINQDEMELDEVIDSNSQPASPPVLKTTHNGLYWVHHTGAAQPKPIPVPNEEKKIVTFARDGRMFIRMYLGSPRQQSEHEDADDERESARSDSDPRSATPDDDGYMFVAGTQSSVDWQADLPERPMFSPVNWNQSSPGVASLEESIPPEETVPVSGQFPTPYNERIAAEAGNDAIDVDENYDQYARSMSGQTAVGKSQTPFHKEVSPFASAVENWKISSPVKEGNHVSNLSYNIKNR